MTNRQSFAFIFVCVYLSILLLAAPVAPKAEPLPPVPGVLAPEIQQRLQRFDAARKRLTWGYTSFDGREYVVIFDDARDTVQVLHSPR